MAKILLSELAAKLVERNGLNKKAATNFVNELFNVVQDGLGEERLVKIKGLGTFKIIEVNDRESVNVNTGERVLIEGHSKISFIPDSTMKELVNKPFSQFDTVVLNEGVDFEDVPKEEPKVEEPVDLYDELDASAVPLVEFVTDEPEIEEPVIEAPQIEEPQSDAPLILEPEEKEFETPETVDAVPDEPTDSIDPIVSEEPATSEEPIAPIADFVPSTEEDTPVVDAPVLEAPVEETLIEETPMEEDSTEGPEVVNEDLSESDKKEEEENDDEDYEDDEEDGSQSKKWIIFIVVLLLCGLSFGGGYYFGKSSSTPEIPILDADSQAIVKEYILPDSLMEAKPEMKTATKPEAKPAAKPEVKPTAKPEAKPAPQEPVDLDKYEQMDSRVRIGAYRIVGTDHVEKIRETDNLARICKRTIGPDMECYLMVYNGIKSDADLKPGANIKIPKLELKKKKVKKEIK